MPGIWDIIRNNLLQSKVGQTSQGTFYPDIGRVGNFMTGNKIPPQVSTPTPQVPTQFMPQPTPTLTPTPTPKPAQSDDRWMKVLLAAGVPLAAIIAGSANPDWLPAMAGLSEGYGKGIKESIKETGTKDYIIIDPETGEKKVYKVPKKAQVSQKREKGIDFGTLIADFEKPKSKTTKEITNQQSNRKYIVNPQTKQRAYSDDGGVTWIDETTGTIIE